MAPAKARRKAHREEEDAGEVFFLISSDDDEANVDLSARIVAKSRNRENPILIEDSTAEVKNKRKSKKQKRSRPNEIGQEDLRKISGDEEGTDCRDDIKKRLKNEKQRTSPPAELAEEDHSDNIIFRKLLRGPRYFEPGSARLDTCYNCFEEGHTAAECTAEKRQKPCFVCGMFGHNAYKCVQGQDCFICKQRGHMAKDCPKKHKMNNPDSQLCLRCGDVGHDMSSCRNEYPIEDLQKIQCYVCKGFGHLCCALYEDTSPVEVSCYVCGESGHSGMGCARHWGEAAVDKAPKICYICGEEGHLARRCTQRSATSTSKRKATSEKQAGRSPSSSAKVKSSRVCYICGEKGHFAHSCTRGTPSSSSKHEKRRGEFIYSTPNSTENGRSGGHFGHSKRRKDYMDSRNRSHVSENGKNWDRWENSRPRVGWIVDDDPRDFDRRSWSMYERSAYTPRMPPQRWDF